MSQPMTRDMKPRPCKLFDLENREVGTVMLSPRLPREPLRRIIWQGRPFLEGDGTGFYGPDEFAEIQQ